MEKKPKKLAVTCPHCHRTQYHFGSPKINDGNFNAIGSRQCNACKKPFVVYARSAIQIKTKRVKEVV